MKKVEQGCVDCPRSLICLARDDDDWEGTASACPEHDNTYVFTGPKPASLGQPGFLGHSGHTDGDGVGTSMNWKEQNFYAKELGISCNCKAAERCYRLFLLMPGGNP